MNDADGNGAARALKWGGWSIFGTSRRAPRERRPTDAGLLIVAIVLLGLTAWRAEPAGELDTALSKALNEFPSVLGPLWQIAIDVIVIWCVVLLLAAIATKRAGLLAELLAAGAIALTASAVVGRLVNSTWPDLADALLDSDGPPSYPATRIALMTAVMTAASPHLGRPFRFLGRALLTAAAIGVVVLGVSLVGGTIGGLAIGLAAATMIHLVIGSPGWRPHVESVVAALSTRGLDLVEDGDARFSGGVAHLPMRDRDGTPYSVDVHGRDAWQGQFVSSLMRFLTYRGAQPNFSTGRVKEAEHQAFITLLAEGTGANVARVVTVAESAVGDAILVLERPGASLEHVTELDGGDQVATELWATVSSLHAVSIAHGAVDARAVVIDHSGTARLTNFATSFMADDPGPLRSDDAQLLALTADLVGNERAIDIALGQLGRDRLGEVVPFIQRPVMSATMRDQIKFGAVDLDDLRSRAVEATGIDEPEMAKLRRVTWGSILQLALLLIAAWVVFSAIAEVGLSSIINELSGASWQWVIACLIFAQLARLPAGVATMGATIRAVRLWPAVLLDYAIAFVNLAIPATAARVAVKIQFFRKHGASAPEAVSISALDAIANTGLQVMILILLPLLGVASLNLNLDVSFGSHTTALVVIIGVLAAAIVATMMIERLRNKVVPPIKSMLGSFQVLRSPQKVLMLVGGNLGSQLGFALGLWAALHAFDTSLGVIELLYINAAVSLLAGLLPIPGGIGISEAALAAGMVAAGVSSETAAAAAVLYRIMSFYVPPTGGYFAFKWMQRNDYL